MCAIENGEKERGKCDHDEYSDNDNDEKELGGKEYYSL